MLKKLILVLFILAILPLGSVLAQESNSEVRNLVESFAIEGESERNIEYVTAQIESIMEAVGAEDFTVDGDQMTIQASQWIPFSEDRRYGCGGGMQGVFMVEVEPCIGWEEHQAGGETIYVSATYRDGLFDITVLPPTDNPTSNMLDWTEVALTDMPAEMQEVASIGCKGEPKMFQNLTQTFVVCKFRMYGGEILPLGGIIADDDVGSITVYQPYDSVIDSQGNYMFTTFENAVDDDWTFYFGSPSVDDDVEQALAEMVGDLPSMTEVLFETNAVQIAVAELLGVDVVAYQPALNVFYSDDQSWFPMSVRTVNSPWAGTTSAYNAFDMWEETSHIYVNDACSYVGGRENAGTFCEGLPLAEYDWVSTYPEPICENGNPVLIVVGDYRYPFCDNWYADGHAFEAFPQN